MLNKKFHVVQLSQNDCKDLMTDQELTFKNGRDFAIEEMLAIVRNLDHCDAGENVSDFLERQLERMKKERGY